MAVDKTLVYLITFLCAFMAAFIFYLCTFGGRRVFCSDIHLTVSMYSISNYIIFRSGWSFIHIPIIDTNIATNVFSFIFQSFRRVLAIPLNDFSPTYGKACSAGPNGSPPHEVEGALQWLPTRD